MRRVYLESPYAGDVPENVAYARECVADCLRRGESAYASHLFFTQPGILDDAIPEQRALGIQAGLAWAEAADATVVYMDHGVSPGMQLGIDAAEKTGRRVERRWLKRPDFDVRWQDGPTECMFGAEDHEYELSVLQDKICEAAEVTVLAYREEELPYQAHIYMSSGGRSVWAGVMNRPDRPITTYEVNDALIEWRRRRVRPSPMFRVEWWSEPAWHLRRREGGLRRREGGTAGRTEVAAIMRDKRIEVMWHRAKEHAGLGNTLWDVYIFGARYGGAYEGAKWLAWIGDPEWLDDHMGNDIECPNFWDDYRTAPIGRG